MKNVLIVEDDPALHANIKEAFRADDWHTESAFDGNIAHRLLSKHEYDLVVLDINLPGKNGYEVTKELRQKNSRCPVLMLTAFDELEDKVAGFEAGADDYLTKPFYTKELLLRAHALVKRSESSAVTNAMQTEFTFDDIIIRNDIKKVTRQGVVIDLTAREYQILFRLIRAQGELVSKRELIKEIWGTAFDANTNTIEVYINFLRKKLDKPFAKNTIKTRIGFGYYLEATK